MFGAPQPVSDTFRMLYFAVAVENRK